MVGGPSEERDEGKPQVLFCVGAQFDSTEAKEALTKAYYYLHEFEVKYVDGPAKLDNILEKITFD
ncbi:MAG: hypothetical protein WAV32_01830 [Halobacteriota archaeon]